MTPKSRPLPPRPAYGPTEQLEAFVHFRSPSDDHAPDRDLHDARQAARWYETLADNLAAGERVPVGWTTDHAAEVARLIHFHCGRLGSELERVEDILADRRHELDELRPLLEPEARRERITRHGRAFVEREDASIRERLEFLEIEQTRVMVRDVGAGAFLSGLVLGSLAARVGADPFVQRATTQARIARDVAEDRGEQNRHRNRVWDQRDRELEAEGDPNQTSRARTIAAEVSTPERPVKAEQVRHALYQHRKKL